MRRVLLIVGCILGVGLLAYTAAYCWKMREASAARTDRDGLLWLRAEYKLSDEQFARVKTLHEAYQPKCDDLCRRARDSEANIARLIAASRSVTPELRTALQDREHLQAECQAAMLVHAYETAAVMQPEQAQHYLHFISRCMMHGHGDMHGMMNAKP
jgi:uncharacterized membrane protein